jgi:predicted RNase H-like HicB family nuclease
MRDASYYQQINYPVEIQPMPDGIFRAEIRTIPGLCAYGNTMVEALEELDIVKTTAFELMLEQGKEIPLPTVHLEIPLDEFEQLANRTPIGQFVVS